MIIWAGMPQSGPQRDIVHPWAQCTLKTRDHLILLTQWQAPAPKQWILVSWDSERSQIWAWGEFAPTSHRIQSILRHHQHFCSYPQNSFPFLPIFTVPFSSVLFPFSFIASRERSFLFKAFVLSIVRSYFSSFFGWLYSFLCLLYEWAGILCLFKTR